MQTKLPESEAIELSRALRRKGMDVKEIINHTGWGQKITGKWVKHINVDRSGTITKPPKFNNEDIKWLKARRSEGLTFQEIVDSFYKPISLYSVRRLCALD